MELESLSVEHVLPQKWREADYPFTSSGDGKREERARLLHSIGNLTLVTPRFNGALSNEPFRIKRTAIVGESALRLNTYFQQFSDDDAWNEATIVDRAKALFPIAKSIWAYPNSA